MWRESEWSKWWHIEIDDVTQTNKFAMAAALWIAKEVGVKRGKGG